jgi:hypothetical protein
MGPWVNRDGYPLRFGHASSLHAPSERDGAVSVAAQAPRTRCWTLRRCAAESTHSVASSSSTTRCFACSRPWRHMYDSFARPTPPVLTKLDSNSKVLVSNPFRIRQVCNAAGQSFEEAKQEFVAEKQPMARYTRPEDIGALAVFLAGDAAATITGASYSIDGGWTAQ